MLKLIVIFRSEAKQRDVELSVVFFGEVKNLLRSPQRL